MPFFIFHKDTLAGKLLSQLETRIDDADCAAYTLAQSVEAYTYRRDERFIAGEIIGFLFTDDLTTGKARRKGLKKVGEVPDPDNNQILYNYFPDDTDRGRRLLNDMRSITGVKEAELNLLFGVQSVSKAMDFQLCASGYYVIQVNRHVEMKTNELTPLLEEISEGEVREILEGK